VRNVALACLLLLTSTTAAAQERLWIWFDDDGTPNISDRRDAPDAEPYVIGTYEAVLLRQQNTPHEGVAVVDVDVARVPADVYALVTEMAAKHKVERALVLAVVGAESGYRHSARSRVGAIGLMQLMPDTAADLNVDPTVMRENVEGGTRYLAWLLRYFKEPRLAVAAYNAGPGRVKRAGNRVPDIKETRAYVERVLGLRAGFARAGV
jgi:soluble lytic murein transglycosylase-like protein